MFDHTGDEEEEDEQSMNPCARKTLIKNGHPREVRDHVHYDWKTK
jgi:hypothetical protein